MLTGRISLDLQARLSVEILDQYGQPHPVEVLLDTGFNGSLALPPRTIRQLELPPKDEQQDVELANGETDRLSLYVGIVLWNGRPRRVDVIETDSDSLLGMALLQGSRVTLDVRYGGPVAVTPLP